MKTNAEIRRENARALAHELGRATDLARKVGMTDSQVGQLIGKNPRRNIGPRVARHLEEACGKPAGWLDVEHSASAGYGMLRDLQLQEGERIMRSLNNADLSQAISWLQALLTDAEKRNGEK